MKRTHWQRVVIAAIFSEVGVTAALFASFFVYMLATGTPWDTMYNSRGEEISYYVAPPAAFLMTALAVLWATRRLTSDFIRHGLLVGLAAVLLTFAFIVGARPEHRLMYIVSFALRIVGGFAGGTLAQRLFRARNAPSRVQAA
jgi:hypothetical protein